MLFGMSDFIDYIREETSATLFYLNGYTRLDDTGRGFLVRAAIASRVAEGVQSELMQDSRVAHTLPDLWQAAGEELHWVSRLGDDFWSPLADACGSSVQELKSDCIHAAHVSFHFLWRRIFEPAAEYPWRLVRGELVQIWRL